ncbi:hypothetical protein F5Y17DRAFT_465812 [Xylariaceae sp. FL0594]|nr:hypothetical protein F5Y17DRAFT_465812 [Xylariaceae sp. FL0594]
MPSSWEPASNYRSRPVAVLGGGVLGRRIAACWASAGYNVQVRELNAETGAQCVEYVKKNIESYPSASANKGRWGSVSYYQDLEPALKDAWLAVEAIPERIELKISTFAELESLAPKDAILATNSSSFRSGEMLEKVSDVTKARVMNTHYFMPPRTMLVELMTSGYTHPAIIAFMRERQKEAGTIPYVARKESTGFIFNRLWAAVKREILTILSDEVSSPEEIDAIWIEMFAKGGWGPCQLMDQIGLDTVDFIERHYIHERGLSSEKTVDFLKKNYLDQGRLGAKSPKGGLYPRVPKLLVLDVGLAARHNPLAAGKILEVSGDGKSSKVLLDGLSLPDGIDYDLGSQRMFWTCMGVPGVDDGGVFSANLDGTDVRTIVPKGVVNTPKQLVVESTTKKLYFCDREGMRVVRCGYDGGDLEVLVKNGDWKEEGTDVKDKWCVGIAVSPKRGKFYWTQKGPSKSGLGRIFCADIDGPAIADRTDIQLVLDKLPEPIDLEVDEEGDSLYWTDRGELPLGNTLNKALLNPVTGMVNLGKDGKSHRILCSHFNETIGLKLDSEAGCVYVTDLSGTVYRCSLDGSKKERVYTQEDAAFTGIAVL